MSILEKRMGMNHRFPSTPEENHRRKLDKIHSSNGVWNLCCLIQVQ